jgi:amino acid permease
MGAAKSSTTTISSAAFNLIKGAVGSGVLSLPAGVAAYGDVRRA